MSFTSKVPGAVRHLIRWSLLCDRPVLATLLSSISKTAVDFHATQRRNNVTYNAPMQMRATRTALKTVQMTDTEREMNGDLLRRLQENRDLQEKIRYGTREFFLGALAMIVEASKGVQCRACRVQKEVRSFVRRYTTMLLSFVVVPYNWRRR